MVVRQSGGEKGFMSMPAAVVESILHYRPNRFRPGLLCGVVQSEFALELERDPDAQGTLSKVTGILRSAYRRLIDGMSCEDVEELRRLKLDFELEAKEAIKKYKRRTGIREFIQGNGATTAVSTQDLVADLDKFGDNYQEIRQAKDTNRHDAFWTLLKGQCRLARMIRCKLVALFALEEQQTLRPLFDEAVRLLELVAVLHEDSPPDSCEVPQGPCYLRNIWMRYHYVRLLRDIVYVDGEADEKKLAALAVLDLVHRRGAQHEETKASIARMEPLANGLVATCESALSEVRMLRSPA
jgi:hypothetical protein